MLPKSTVLFAQELILLQWIRLQPIALQLIILQQNRCRVIQHLHGPLPPPFNLMRLPMGDSAAGSERSIKKPPRHHRSRGGDELPGRGRGAIQRFTQRRRRRPQPALRVPAGAHRAG